MKAHYAAVPAMVAGFGLGAVTQEANVPSLIKDTPYAKLRQPDFYRSLR